MFNDSRDARRRLLKLTPAGHKLQRELVADILERTQIALLGFTRGEQVLLSEFIERLTNNVTLLEKANE
jgi:DNA-binding MarR family transcriptional regulator